MDYTFKAAFGDEERQVELTQVAFSAGTTYHVYVGGYFWAWISLDIKSNKWKLRIQTDKINDLLTSDDRQILEELVKEHFDNNGWYWSS